MITTLLYSLFALDQTLAGLAAQHAWLLFAALFIVIFAETGLVVFPLLPGDSLLFLAGTVVAASGINVHLLVLTLFIAAVLGDSVNYGIGRYVGPKVFHRPQDSVLGRFLKPQYLERTRRYYEKYGGFTIVIGRFVPIVRTFAPFLAGIGAMTYRTFLSYNVLGAAVWVSSARLRRLPVRQHSVGQGQPRVHRRRHRRHIAHPDGACSGCANGAGAASRKRASDSPRQLGGVTDVRGRRQRLQPQPWRRREWPARR